MVVPEPPTGRAVVVGLDLGGTKIAGRALWVDAPDDALGEVRLDTPSGERAVLDAMVSAVDALQRRPEVVAAGGVGAVGVGAAGLVDAEGFLRFAPNLPGLIGVPMRAALTERLSLPVVVDNDANCAAWAEVAAGAARGASDAVVVTLGTGIGAGFVVDGRLYRGAHGFAAEPGHMIVVPDGPPCPCGRRGCWERFASGSGLARLAHDAAAAGLVPEVVRLVGGDPGAVRGEHVTEAAGRGDPAARRIVEELAGWVALGLANLTNLLDPEIIVIGGGLVEAGELLLGPVRTAFADALFAPAQRPEVPIVPAAFGSEAGAVGAALLASASLI